jgi:hypothetical protein
VTAAPPNLKFMTRFVRAAGTYNASAIIVFLTPGALDLVNVRGPYPEF